MAFTYFFRDPDVLEQIAKAVIENFLNLPLIKIWDAGCATGEEAYSLAMILAEKLTANQLEKLRILATDHEENANFGDMVTQGIYPSHAATGCPRFDLLRKYCYPADKPNHIQVIEQLRSLLIYKRHNLLSLNPPDKEFHVILCKNVLLHFNEESQANVVNMFHQALIPGGILALDQSQTVPQKVSSMFRPTPNCSSLYEKN